MLVSDFMPIPQIFLVSVSVRSNLLNKGPQMQAVAVNCILANATLADRGA